MHDYNLTRGRRFRRRFDDLDFVPRSQVCQSYKLQTVLFRILFRVLSTVVEMLYGCYIHLVDHVQYEVCDSGMCSRELIYMFLAGQVSRHVENWDFLRHHKCNKCQTFYDGTTIKLYLFLHF